jgi:hypothetical protein
MIENNQYSQKETLSAFRPSVTNLIREDDVIVKEKKQPKQQQPPKIINTALLMAKGPSNPDLFELKISG